MNGFILKPVSRTMMGVGPNFTHFFGGELDVPVVPPGGSAPCHLLYLIDTLDPLFPARVPGVRFLPLIYCPQYNAAAMAYQVTPDGIIIDSIESFEWSVDFPYPNYPSKFPRREVNLAPVSVEHQGIIARYAKAQDYPRDWNAIGECEKVLTPMGYPYTQFGGVHVMWQGIPEVVCANPLCGCEKMDVFGVIWDRPIEEVFLWDDDPTSGSGDVQIIYQICSSCSAIHVCNRCT